MMHLRFSPSIVCASLVVAGGPGRTRRVLERPRPASEQFAALLDDAWQFQLQENPLFATETGDHRYDDQLPKVSLADAKRRNAASREFLERLEAIDRSQLTPAEQVSYDIFARQEREDRSSVRLRRAI